MLDPKTRQLRAVLTVRGDRVERYFDPPDHFYETTVETTLAQKPLDMSWDEFLSQLPDRPPYTAWWEQVSVKADSLPEAFDELLEHQKA